MAPIEEDADDRVRRAPRRHRAFDAVIVAAAEVLGVDEVRSAISPL